MADNLTPGPHEFSASQEKSMRAGRRASFDPQGPTGGGVNHPGLLSNGKPAAMRSESTEFEKARRSDPGPAPVLQHLLSPAGASNRDLWHGIDQAKKAATGGYDD